MKRNIDSHKNRFFGSKFETKRDCKKFSKVMARYNVASSVLAIVLLAIYVIHSARQASTSSVNGFQRIALETTRQINEYLTAQTDNLEDIIYYIDFIKDEQDSIEEVLESVSYYTFLDGNLAMVNMNSYDGIIVQPKRDREDPKANEIQKVDFRDNAVIKALCDDEGSIELAVEDEEDFGISDVFKNPFGHKNAFAIYCETEIEEEEYLFCYIMDVSRIYEEISKNTSLNECGIIIDSHYNLLGGMPGANEKEIDEARKLLQYLKEDDTIQHKKEKADDTCGVFVVKNDKRIDNIYIYVKIEPLGEWYYISRISEKPLVDYKGIAFPVVGALLLIAIPWCINVIVVFLQNRKLMRILVTLEESNEQLEAANKAQTAFISSMSHEIRTPINAVLGMDEMIIRETSEEMIRGYAYDIRNAGKSLLGIVNDILDFTKIESGKMDIIEDEYEVSSVVNDLVNMTRARIGDKELAFRIELNPQIPHLLFGDEIHIKQIILNILTNAVKYNNLSES